MIARVGHVRVFAALGSMISASFILYAAAPEVWVWIALRFVVGFAFAGVYVVAESWLNDAATNETRGQALSLYMIVQMVGIISAQFILNLADPAGYTLFVVMSVLVSLCFTPILLAAGTGPAFQTTKPMTLVQLFRISPLGCVGTFLLGGVLPASSAWPRSSAPRRGPDRRRRSRPSSRRSTSAACVFQFPIGWISDRMDRRQLIMRPDRRRRARHAPRRLLLRHTIAVVLVLGFVIGGVANPLYSLIIAYTNDFLDSRPTWPPPPAGLLFINGLGAMTGPLHHRRADDPLRRRRLLRLHRHALRADRALRRLPHDPPRRAAGETSSYAPVAAAGLAGGARGRAGSRHRARRRGAARG